MAITATKLYTVDEWMDLPEEQTQRTELVDGEIVAMGNARFLHEKLKSVWFERLVLYLTQHRIGRAYSETMYRLRPDTARIPDVSVLIPDRPTVDGPCEGAPEIAIEIVSSESASEVDRRIRDYLAYGSRLVIITYTDQRVWCYTPDGTAKLYTAGHHLEIAELPGFRLAIAELFAGL